MVAEVAAPVLDEPVTQNDRPNLRLAEENPRLMRGAFGPFVCDIVTRKEYEIALNPIGAPVYDIVTGALHQVTLGPIVGPSRAA